jgi:hypothetical protein
VQSANDLWYGVRKNRWKFVTHVFTCFSVMFTLVKAVTQFIPGIHISGTIPLGVLVIVSLGWGVKKVWKPSKITFKIAHCNTCLEILFGDIFEQDGFRAIAVTEFFETQLGRPVSDMSLHGAFLKRHFAGRQGTIDKEIADQLATVESTTVPKVDGKDQCYPIGTTALIRFNDERFLLFALAKADPTNCKAHSDVELMWRALYKLWARARVECGGHPVNLPLVGSGLSGLGLPTRDLLNLIVLSAIAATKAHEITQVIRIVVWRDKFEDIDLRDVKSHWEGK